MDAPSRLASSRMLSHGSNLVQRAPGGHRHKLPIPEIALPIPGIALPIPGSGDLVRAASPLRRTDRDRRRHFTQNPYLPGLTRLAQRPRPGAKCRPLTYISHISLTATVAGPIILTRRFSRVSNWYSWAPRRPGHRRAHDDLPGRLRDPRLSSLARDLFAIGLTARLIARHDARITPRPVWSVILDMEMAGQSPHPPRQWLICAQSRANARKRQPSKIGRSLTARARWWPRVARRNVSPAASRSPPSR